MKIIATCILIATTPSVFAADLSQDLTMPDGVVVHLPASWKQIPKSVITAQLEAFYRQNPNAPQIEYDYGFQAQSKNWFSYPYILVKTQRGGRIPESALKEMPNLDQTIYKGAREASDAVSAMSEVTIDKPLYDAVHRILWWSGRTRIEGMGYIKQLTGAHLTEAGMIGFSATSREEDFPRFKILFHQIITNVELPTGMRYVPRVTDNIPLVRAIDWDEILKKAMLWGVVGGIFALIMGLVNRNKKDSHKLN